MGGRFEAAAIAIFISLAMDGLDGKVARATNTQSDFGAEYDSLCDLVSFGIAPALVVYQWQLSNLGKFGWLLAFVYAACTALRLARFNTQIGVISKKYFQGLPSPAAASIVGSLVWVSDSYAIAHDVWLTGFTAFITGGAALLMVSNVRYNSLKEVDLKGKVPFVALLFLLIGLVVLFSDPPAVLFVVFLVYAFSGPVLTIWGVNKAKKAKKERRNAR